MLAGRCIAHGALLPLLLPLLQWMRCSSQALALQAHGAGAASSLAVLEARACLSPS